MTHLENYGTVILEASDTEFISLALPEPIHHVNPADNGNLYIHDIRLSADCVEWKVTYDDMERLYNLSPNDEGFHEGFEKQLQWISFLDEIMSSAYLTFEDGSTQQLTPSIASPYENGVVTLTSDWNATIDISKIKSITVMGTTYSFPQIIAESVSS